MGHGWHTSHPTTLSKEYIILIYHYLHTVWEQVHQIVTHLAYLHNNLGLTFEPPSSMSNPWVIQSAWREDQLQTLVLGLCPSFNALQNLLDICRHIHPHASGLQSFWGNETRGANTPNYVLHPFHYSEPCQRHPHSTLHPFCQVWACHNMEVMVYQYDRFFGYGYWMTSSPTITHILIFCCIFLGYCNMWIGCHANQPGNSKYPKNIKCGLWLGY